MKIEKVYETVINLSAQEMDADIDQVVMDKLKKYFEGRCRENSLVISINKIIKRSKCQMAKSRTDGSGDVNVQYQAEAITYSPGDILPNCEIFRIEKDRQIMCKYDDKVIALIKGNPLFQRLKPKQKIAILIRGVSYVKEKDRITAYGIPYTYPTNFTIYAFSEEFDSSTLSPIALEKDEADASEDIEILRRKLLQIETEKNALEETDANVRKFLADVYYPYKQSPANNIGKLPKSIQLYDLSELLNIVHDKKSKHAKKFVQGTLLFRHPVIDKSTSVVMISESEDLKKGLSHEDLFNPDTYKFSLVYEKPTRILMALLDDYLKFIVLLKETATEFGKESALASHQNVWDMYRFIKK
jgi:hypothetical protein